MGALYAGCLFRRITSYNVCYTKLLRLDARFNQLLSDAEKQVTEKKYSEAIALFDQALEIRAGDQTVIARQNEIKALMMQAQERDASYSALLAEADQLFSSSRLTEARAKYTEAGQVKPEEARVITSYSIHYTKLYDSVQLR